jgi:hypothetical protein
VAREWITCVLLIGAWPEPSLAKPPNALLPPESSGVIIVSVDPSLSDDARLRLVAARLVGRGLEGCLVSDLARPRVDADLRVDRARERISAARAAYDSQHWSQAATFYDDGIAILETSVHQAQDLSILIAALTERGATALKKNSPSDAEEYFARASRYGPSEDSSSRRLGEQGLALLHAVAEAVRGLRPGKVHVDAGPFPAASVSIDFADPAALPIDASLSPGLHFVSVIVPERSEVVVPIRVASEKSLDLFIRPPPLGDPLDRTRAVDGFRALEAASESRVVAASGLRFMLLVQSDKEGLELLLHDRTGIPIAAASARLPAAPTALEIDRALDSVLAAAALVEPALRPPAEGSSDHWYATWWGVSLIALAAVGAAGGTVFLISRAQQTEYVFRP